MLGAVPLPAVLARGDVIFGQIITTLLYTSIRVDLWGQKDPWFE